MKASQRPQRAQGVLNLVEGKGVRGRSALCSSLHNGPPRTLSRGLRQKFVGIEPLAAKRDEKAPRAGPAAVG